jgi:hypothetical protein
MHIGFLWHSKNERDHYEDICERIILKWIFEEYDWKVLTGLIWLRIETSGDLL